MVRNGILAVLGTALLLGTAGESLSAMQVHGEASDINYEADISPLLANYCVSCHSGANPMAAVSLQFSNEDAARRMAATEDEFWTRVARNLTANQMPPVYAPDQPTEEERERLVAWINDNVLTPDGQLDPGPFMVRRMNNREYANTLRDLLYLPDDYDVASDFPADERGDGYDNNAGTLTISPLLIEHYLSAAEKATVEALGLDAELDSEIRDNLPSRLALNEPSAGVDSDYADRLAIVRLNLETFAPRAFRRPVTSEEIDELMEFASLSFAHSGLSSFTFDEATALAIRAALLSPEFLFRLERDPAPDGTSRVFELDEYELASRLSYFLWSTMPDDELFIAARDGTLRSDLDAHVVRMLNDPKAISLTRDFLGQWLEVRSLHEVANAPEHLLTAMLGETEHFFNYIVQEDRSIMDFLDSDYTFVNEPLAELYGIPDIEGDAFQRVQVDRARRGGIFTQASFLTLTSKPLGDTRRTSPVMRGKYIIENIFSQTIPPPPPDVPELEFDPNAQLVGTVREIFEQHREDPSCASCHARMDPYGFALENYDGFGAWREQDNQVDVDASGEIDGKEFTTPVEFRAILAEREDDFRRSMVRQMLSYALGRGIQVADRTAIEEIVAAVEAEGDSFSSLIINIVESYPFQHARSSPGEPLPVGHYTSAELFHPVREAQPETEEVTEARGRAPALGQVPARIQSANAGEDAAAADSDPSPIADENQEETQ